MGFFFADVKREQKAKPKATGPRKISPKLKQSADTLNRLGCKVCPLAKDCGDRVYPNLPDKRTDVLFLAEGPSEKDENKGKPMYGKAGALLKEQIPEDYDHVVGFANIVQHRTPNDRDPEWAEIESCRGYVTAAIEKAKPKLIVGLGLLALQWVLGSSDITGMRGRIFSVQVGKHQCFFMPTYSPNYVMKSAYDDAKPLQSRQGHAFRMDIEAAFLHLEKKLKPTVVSIVEAKSDINCYNGKDPKHLEQVLDEFKRAMKAKRWALDFEGYPLRPYHKDATLVSASISFWKGDNVHTFAFALNHPKAGWSPSQLRKILAAFKKLVMKRGRTKIAHNVPFELEWLFWLFGLEIADHRAWEDTMMQAHLLDERKGPSRDGQDRRPTYQSLDFLCRLHLGLKLKSMFQLDKKDMRKSDVNDCLLYNGTDSKYTLVLHDIQQKLLDSFEMLDLFDFIKPRQTTVAIMQHLGMPLDHAKTLEFQKKLDGEVKEIEKQIADLKVVKQFSKDKGRQFNPQSQPELVELLRDYLKRTEINVAGKKFGDADRVAVDKGVLDRIDHPIAQLIIKLRNRQKLKSTYVDEFVPGSGSLVWPDGKLHTNFNTTFTQSGRTSSDEPNMQNFPKREDAWVRAQVAAPKGYVLLSVDYGQLEWCLACVCCRDKVMVEATWQEYDVHMEWASKIAAKWPELVGGKKNVKNRDDEDSKKKYKKARSLVKNKMVFPVIFGATEDSVRGYLNMPEKVAKEIFEEFWATFGGLAKWHKEVMKKYYGEGYIANLFGRRRRYPMSKNEAINHPIQSTAADIVCDAMDRLSMLACKTGKWHLHPHLNIHDDLTFLIPDDEEVIDESIMLIVEEMLKLPFDFINVPMSCEVSLGTNWENQKEVGKFWTTDIGRHTDEDKPKALRKKQANDNRAYDRRRNKKAA